MVALSISRLQRQRLFQASPSMSRLATRPRRNRFVILRTASSPPVALHPLDRLLRSNRGDAVTFDFWAATNPGADLHRADKASSRTHSWPGNSPGHQPQHVVEGCSLACADNRDGTSIRYYVSAA